MNDMDREQFGVIIAAMCETYGKEASVPQVRGYWMGLQDLTIEQVSAGVAKALRSSKFLPTVAEIREQIGGSADDRAVQAFGELSRAIERQGYYRSVDFADKRINAVVRNLGGWMYLCDQSKEEFEKWTRQAFLKAYRSYEVLGVSEEAGAALVGYAEQQNRQLGREDAEPQRLGTEVTLLLERQ